jgi:hypothetical protein
MLRIADFKSYSSCGEAILLSYLSVVIARLDRAIQ